MPEVAAAPYSFREDPNVPRFDDGKALFVFDGVCVLCSGGANWLMRFDKRRLVNFASMQSTLGQALYRHAGVVPDESYLLVKDGRIYTATKGYLELCGLLGGLWSVFRIGALIPERWRDAGYAAIARNRYRWFGRAEYCQLLTADQRARLIDD